MGKQALRCELKLRTSRISNPTVTGSNPVGVTNLFNDLWVIGDQNSFEIAEIIRNKNAFRPSDSFEALIDAFGDNDQQMGSSSIYVRK